MYFGDMLSASGGCTQAIIAICRSALGTFKKLLPILTSRHLIPLIRGRLFNTYVRSALLHGSKTWAPTVHDLQRTDRAIASAGLLKKMGLEDITVVLRTKRLR